MTLNLKAWRDKWGLSQEKAAIAAKVTLRTWQRREKGGEGHDLGPALREWEREQLEQNNKPKRRKSA